ncbi:16S rRNA (guanine(966)-N(2))-methyltransferase RsmD [Pustulibacterium marinum]|uniref:16S rRNA (Guanine(966)-N(2))-methyltransferase RsmD n=1 Tax=Pustulibacterium marinum TaxID=1224947 RepID=A0A1I7G2L3_9FLAO|nr:RsmD family RNA methyltransferase [Pustulibacterium marinum]SFU42678.1 16S rRNA (guanine(966)-N(2))-methyltransferase RsmD [Pustulibacterium marinum]
MRIISGKYKGKRLMAPSKLPVRPTTDFAKEALFNILNNSFYFDEVSLLDLFSGTGNISYEFASRGCKEITAVDANIGCVQYINKTAKELDFDIRTFKSDVFKFLEKTMITADIIFADPPYDFSDEQFAEIPKLVFERNLVSEEGYLIVEHSKHTKLSELPFFAFDKRYGGSVFSFFEIPSDEEDIEE